MAIPNGENPPLPFQANGSFGRELMAVVRQERRDETATLLRYALEVFSRQGILQGNVEKAEQLLASSGSQTLSGGGGKGKKKNKNKQKAGIELSLGEAASTGESSSNATSDETLILSALARFLGGTHELSSTPSIDESNLVSICLAADTITAVSQRIQSLMGIDTCAMAEYEVMGASGRNLLTGLVRTSRALLTSPSSDKKALTACLQGAGSLISLFGVRLSRSSAIVASLKKGGWMAIVDRDGLVRTTAACLLSTLPLAGADNTAPSEKWSSELLDGLSALSLLMEAVVPLKIRGSSQTVPSSRISDDMDASLTKWIDSVREGADEVARVEEFRRYMNALTFFLVALLEQRGVGAQTTPSMIFARVPMDKLLHVVEKMLSFASSAESVYYGTKKRLRSEPVQDGLLSPTIIVSEVANFVKSLGHTLFQAKLKSIARPSLLPFGRRIITIAHGALVTSCSTALRKALDPVSTVRLDGKKKRWLHTSVSVRTKGVASFQTAVHALGSNTVAVSFSVGAQKNRSSSDGPKGVVLICGCLLEQLHWKDCDDDWGNLSDRLDLVQVAAEAIVAILTSVGGYLPFGQRSLIDSVALKCISQYNSKKMIHMATWSPVKVVTLKLGMACITTPWPDSALSSLEESLRCAAKSLSQDSDANVSSTARVCLGVCDSLCMSRAPPLSIVTRTTEVGSRDSNSEPQQTAEEVVQQLRLAKEEISAARERQSLEIAQKAEKKRSKKSRETIGETKSQKKAKVDETSKRDSPQAPETKIEPLGRLLDLDTKDAAAKQAAQDETVATRSPAVMEASASSDVARKHLPRVSKPPNEEPMTKKDEDDEDEDDDMLMPGIVDCAPDEGDDE